MNTYLVLTVIGDDKPGLVDTLSATIAKNSGNWLESSMSQLAGKFAGILRVSIDAANAEQLEKDLQGLSQHLRINVETVDAATPSIKGSQNRAVKLSLVGNDRPGIVQEISSLLAQLSVNVEKFASECKPGPMSSGDLFQAQADLHTPVELSLDVLQTELEKLADDLMVELSTHQRFG